MLGLATRRKSNGDLTVVSPKDGIEFDVKEDILNINMIELGDFCRIEVKNNVPVSYQWVDKSEVGNFVVNVDETSSAKISDVAGVLTYKLALFYETVEFGSVVCKDTVSKDLGVEYKLTISRLPENERIGAYSKCVWQGVSVGLFANSNKSVEKDLDCMEIHLNGSSSDFSEEDDADKNKTPMKASDSAPLSKYITGFVTVHDINYAYVACNLTYPGTDGKADLSKNGQLEIGDWVKVQFNDDDFKKYFPPKSTSKAPRFNVTNFTKIDPPENYSVTMTDKGPEVKIRNFRLSASHKKGDDIEDRFLGTVSDGEKLIPHRQGLVDLIIRRRKIFKSRSGNFTTWFIKESNKSAKRSENVDTERSSSTARGRVSKKNDKHDKLRQKKDENEPSTRFRQLPHQFVQTSGPHAPPLNWQFGHPGPVAPIESVPVPLNPMSSVFFQSQFVPKIPIVPTSVHTNQRKRFKSLFENEETLVAKRAVVTSVKPNTGTHSAKESMAFLWLLDDHISSVYYFSTLREPNMTAGHFFEGSFYNTGEKWECRKYVKSLGKLMDGILNNGSIELQLTVYNYFPQSPDRLNPETRHDFIGKIIDKNMKLPKDCSSGVKISIKITRLSERNEYCWIVSKVFQSKHIQLLTEFHEAWSKPTIRDTIKSKCYKQFEELRVLMDVPLEGEIGKAYSQFEKEKFEKMDRSLEYSQFVKFAWVTVQDDDFIRMVVFPRSDGQKMSEMKKLVTDKKIYEKVERMEVQKLYSVQLNDNGEVVAIFDCPQYFSAKSNGEIEFKVICCDQTLLARNVALVEPIGVPKWIGKLMLCSGRPITKKKILMKATFRLLKDGDLFVDDEIVCNDGVCFMNCGDVGSLEALPNQELESVLSEENRDIERKVLMHGHNLFKAKLDILSKDITVQKFKHVCRILDNKDVTKEMESQNINIEKLMRLRLSAL
uniref:Ig-like domain-containing protein n=1 Tax=Caenorhabditis tropicalis TaxID=1561998 RepID=A0A1I7T0K7_9PELO